MTTTQDEAASGAPSDNASGNADPKDGRVAYETYQKVLKEKKSKDETVKQLAERLAVFEAEKTAAEEKALQDQGQFKTLLEKEQNLRKAKEAELDSLKVGLQNSIKRSSLEEKLGGKLRNPAYAGVIPFDRIIIDPETMQIDETSLAEVAEELQKDHKVLFDFGTKGNVPPGNAPKTSTTLKYEDWLKLPLKEQKARMKDVQKK